MESRRAAQFGLGLAVVLLVACLSIVFAGSRPPEEAPHHPDTAKVTATGTPVAPR